MTRQREQDMVWAFDVDGTLIGSIRSGVLRPAGCELLTALAARGVLAVLSQMVVTPLL